MNDDQMTPRERRQARTRQAILDAARRIVSRQGADALSMRAIADEIDYSPAGLYEYFPGKEAIVGELCGMGHVRLSASMGAVDESLPFEAYLYGIGEAYIEFARRNPDLYLLMFTTISEATVEGLYENGSSFLILVEAIERGLTEGIIPEREGFGRDVMAYNAWALVHGLAMLAITYGEAVNMPFEAVEDQALRSMLRGFVN